MAIREGFKYYFADFSLRTLFYKQKSCGIGRYFPSGVVKPPPPRFGVYSHPLLLRKKIRKLVFETFPKLLGS